jgi:hypothetical protein
MKPVYSKEPKVIGRFHIVCKEMMFVQDMLIAMPRGPVMLPPNLECFAPLVYAALGCDDLNLNRYVYISAKRLLTSPTCQWNRPGWHIDGYGTDDVNFIWSDAFPTEFCVNQTFMLDDDHIQSMLQMTAQADRRNIKRYSNGSLLRLDNTIVHRVAEVNSTGMRTFVKISVSRNKYNLIGNAHNHLLDYDWEMVPRGMYRNDPAAK